MPSAAQADSDRLRKLKIFSGNPLGCGSFAAVHKGAWEGRPCAVKVLLPNHANRLPQPERPNCPAAMLIREGDVLMCNPHRFLPRCYAVLELPPNFPGLLPGYTSPAPALVLELLERGSLSGLLRRQSITPWKFLYDNVTALSWSIQIASALAHLHGLSPAVIHRDVKLENVLLKAESEQASGDGARDTSETRLPVAKLVDLGLHVVPAHLPNQHRQELLFRASRMACSSAASPFTSTSVPPVGEVKPSFPALGRVTYSGGGCGRGDDSIRSSISSPGLFFARLAGSNRMLPVDPKSPGLRNRNAQLLFLHDDDEEADPTALPESHLGVKDRPGCSTDGNCVAEGADGRSSGLGSCGCGGSIVLPFAPLELGGLSMPRDATCKNRPVSPLPEAAAVDGDKGSLSGCRLAVLATAAAAAPNTFQNIQQSSTTAAAAAAAAAGGGASRRVLAPPLSPTLSPPTLQTHLSSAKYEREGSTSPTRRQFTTALPLLPPLPPRQLPPPPLALPQSPQPRHTAVANAAAIITTIAAGTSCATPNWSSDERGSVAVLSDSSERTLSRINSTGPLSDVTAAATAAEPAVKAAAAAAASECFSPSSHVPVQERTQTRVLSGGSGAAAGLSGGTAASAVAVASLRRAPRTNVRTHHRVDDNWAGEPTAAVKPGPSTSINLVANSRAAATPAVVPPLSEKGAVKSSSASTSGGGGGGGENGDGGLGVVWVGGGCKTEVVATAASGRSGGGGQGGVLQPPAYEQQSPFSTPSALPPASSVLPPPPPSAANIAAHARSLSYEPSVLYESVYRLTGVTGSHMSMAPEVFQGLPYNEKADVFSFGVLLYELFSRSMLMVTHLNTRITGLYRPLLHPQQYAEVVSQGYRPSRTSVMPAPVWSLICACWDQDPVVRPSMAAVVAHLKAMQGELERAGGSGGGSGIVRRGSRASSGGGGGNNGGGGGAGGGRSPKVQMGSPSPLPRCLDCCVIS